MNLSQFFSIELLSGKLRLLLLFLLALTVFNIILSIRLSAKIALIRKETSLIEQQNEDLKTANTNLRNKVSRINSAINANKDKIDFLEAQMLQVHDWLGRLTISDFLESEVTTVEIMETLTERAEWAKKDTKNKKNK